MASICSALTWWRKCNPCYTSINMLGNESSREELEDYIREQLRKDVSPEIIEEVLISEGWTMEDIRPVFASIRKSAQSTLKPLPSINILLSDSFKIFKKLLRIVVSIYVVLAIGEAFSNEDFLMFVGTDKSSTLAALLSILSVGLILISYTVLTYSVVHNGSIKSVRAAYKEGAFLTPSYILVVLIYAAAVFGGMILFIVPGIIFGVWYSVSVYVLFAEKRYGTNALARSSQYVRFRWLDVFWRIIGIVGLAFLVNLLSDFLGTMIKGHLILKLLITRPLQFAVFTLVTIYMYELYRSLRETYRKAFEVT